MNAINIQEVDLSQLPLIQSKNTIDWTNSVGKTAKFNYEGHTGEILIKSYLGKDKLIIEYKGKEFKMFGKSIRNASFRQLFSKEELCRWKYEIGDRIIDAKRDLTLINKKFDETLNNYRRNKFYQYLCNRCGFDSTMDDSWIGEDYLNNRQEGCKCCAGCVVIPGINDIPTIAPWMVKYFQSGEEEAKLYSVGSNQFIDAVCPDCGRVKRIQICQLYLQGLGCICGDGFSYPEKFMASFLNQHHIDFIPQANQNCLSWINVGIRYDFYLPKYNYIIETHGRQHYLESNTNWNKDTEEVIKNDQMKQDLAIKNQISDYIIIDARKSTSEFIANSIVYSNLNKIITNIEQTDWGKCNEYATSNLVKIVCDFYNEKYNTYSTLAIAKHFNLSRSTVARYLNNGNELGWCRYNDSHGAFERKSLNSKPVIIYNDINTYYFQSTILAKEIFEQITGTNFGTKYSKKINTGRPYNGYLVYNISKEEFNHQKDVNPNYTYGDYFLLDHL